MNRSAAFIGPTVCEELGPMPILKTSNVLTAMVAVLRVPEETAILAVHAALPWLRRSISAKETQPVLTLFQRDDCHLCDMALAELAKARAPEFESVFLDDQPALESRYGARVPVLRDERGNRELDWPFDAATVQAWLAVDR